MLLGEDAKGLSANVVSRLKAQWTDEHASWSGRDLSKSRYVYWWSRRHSHVACVVRTRTANACW